MHLSFCSEYGYARGSALKPQTNKRFHALRHFGDSQVLSPGLVPNIKGSSSLDSTARARGEGWILLAGVMKRGGGQGQKKKKKIGLPFFRGGRFFFFFFFGLAACPIPPFYYESNLQPQGGGGVDTVGRRHKGGGQGQKKKIKKNWPPIF